MKYKIFSDGQIFSGGQIFSDGQICFRTASEVLWKIGLSQYEYVPPLSLDHIISFMNNTKFNFYQGRSYMAYGHT